MHSNDKLCKLVSPTGLCETGQPWSSICNYISFLVIIAAISMSNVYSETTAGIIDRLMNLIDNESELSTSYMGDMAVTAAVFEKTTKK